MTTFVIILLLAVVSWYIWSAQSTIFSLKRVHKETTTSISKIQFLGGLESGKVTQPKLASLVDNISQYIHNSSSMINASLIALLSNGHIIIQGQPGTGKTSFVHVLSSLCDLSYSRIQCTPDMMPQDVLGTEVFNQEHKKFTFHPGPIVANIVHVDEINRSTPKLQSAFLQAMQEIHITVGNTRIDMPSPFFLLATQNPYDSVGTYALPYAQIDRFMLSVYTTSLVKKAEYNWLKHKDEKLENIGEKLTKEDIETMQKEVHAIELSDELLEHCVQCVDTIRAYEIAISTRATKALVDASKAWAYMQGKKTVEKDDIDALLMSVCKHRVAHFLGQSISNESLYRIMTGSAQKDDIAVQ